MSRHAMLIDIFQSNSELVSVSEERCELPTFFQADKSDLGILHIDFSK